MDSPAKWPDAGKLPRSAPPYTDRAWEEPWEGGRIPAQCGHLKSLVDAALQPIEAGIGVGQAQKGQDSFAIIAYLGLGAFSGP